MHVLCSIISLAHVLVKNCVYCNISQGKPSVYTSICIAVRLLCLSCISSIFVATFGTSIKDIFISPSWVRYCLDSHSLDFLSLTHAQTSQKCHRFSSSPLLWPLLHGSHLSKYVHLLKPFLSSDRLTLRHYLGCQSRPVLARDVFSNFRQWSVQLNTFQKLCNWGSSTARVWASYSGNLKIFLQKDHC